MTAQEKFIEAMDKLVEATQAVVVAQYDLGKAEAAKTAAIRDMLALTKKHVPETEEAL